jgi:hypothetical protein
VLRFTLLIYHIYFEENIQKYFKIKWQSCNLHESYPWFTILVEGNPCRWYSRYKRGGMVELKFANLRFQKLEVRILMPTNDQLISVCFPWLALHTIVSFEHCYKWIQYIINFIQFNILRSCLHVGWYNKVPHFANL